MKKSTRSHDAEHIADLLHETRLDERRTRANLLSARLDKLADYLSDNALSGTDAVGLLRQEAENIQRQTGELC
ncbi:DUF2732 family protein [Erwinia sp. 9145]|uniref:DUF2732 family protein n=1 Tax=Erwinia sp. 9145 TaxID=1500895 RepID=UPI000555B701|nr:DUF2732 family protein [Erwinia sp. 9145]